MWVFGAIAVLFNPFFPIVFSRDSWQIIDFFVAIVFLKLFFEKNQHNTVLNNEDQ
jgi:hypothetical protein